MPFCKCQEIEVYYETDGEGEALGLVSGLSGGSWSWYEQVPFFKNHFRTVTFDNRGAGRSSMPAGPYSIKQLAKDALCLLDHLAIDKTFLLGLSMGGMIAQELVLLAPDRIQAVVLGCTHCGGDLRIPPSPKVLETFMNNAGLSHEQIVDKNLPFFFSESCRKNRSQVIEAYRKAQLETPLQPEHAFHAQLQAIGTFGCCDRLSQIHVPTLIITGSDDVLVPAANARILAGHIPHAELVEIPGAGHAIHAECREQLNELSLAFFRRHVL